MGFLDTRPLNYNYFEKGPPNLDILIYVPQIRQVT